MSYVCTQLEEERKYNKLHPDEYYDDILNEITQYDEVEFKEGVFVVKDSGELTFPIAYLQEFIYDIREFIKAGVGVPKTAKHTSWEDVLNSVQSTLLRLENIALGCIDAVVTTIECLTPNTDSLILRRCIKHKTKPIAIKLVDRNWGDTDPWNLEWDGTVSHGKDWHKGVEVYLYAQYGCKLYNRDMYYIFNQINIEEDDDIIIINKSEDVLECISARVGDRGRLDVKQAILDANLPQTEDTRFYIDTSDAYSVSMCTQHSELVEELRFIELVTNIYKARIQSWV